MGKRRRRRGIVPLTAVIILCVAAVFAVLYMFVRPQANRGTKSIASKPSVSNSVSASAGKTSSAATGTGGLLMLINKDNALPSSYTPDLTTLDKSYYLSSDKDNRFDSRAAPYMKQMLDDAKSQGVKLVIVSGYRSSAYQQNNFNKKVNEFIQKGYSSSDAKVQAATLVAPPGTSEHESGLSADIVSSDWYNTNKDLTDDFDKTAAFAWLSRNAAQYGFILRYPKDKVSITGYSYEPWHYRFVGKDNAAQITKSGLCLEEYVDRLSSNPSAKK